MDLHFHLRLSPDDGAERPQVWGLTQRAQSIDGSHGSSPLSPQPGDLGPNAPGSNFPAPIPAQAGVLGVAEAFSWPFGNKNVTVEWVAPDVDIMRSGNARRLEVEKSFDDDLGDDDGDSAEFFDPHGISGVQLVQHLFF